MTDLPRQLLQTWARAGARWLPFADAATPQLPLSRLLRLSLFQISVGMALVLLVGTLNRVMIVELGVPASLVALMIALPVVFAPLRALIGFRSDSHRSALGWRRVPFIWKGTMVQFGGLAIMPFALLVLSGGGEAAQWPAWLGPAGAALAFLLVGAGIHITQTAGLALATDLTTPALQPKVVGLMAVAQLVGMVLSALVFGALLADYSPARLIQVIQGSAVMTVALNILALWQQETRQRRAAPATPPSFAQAWALYRLQPQALRRLVAVALGTLAFGMQDVLLEPYGGQVLGLGVGATTQLSATLALGGLLGFTLASQVLGRSGDTFRLARAGVLIGVPAFAAVMVAGAWQSPWLFAAGVALVGFGAGLFAHGMLTATMHHASAEHTGLALGAWGAAQATAAGVAVGLGGVLHDLLATDAALAFAGPALAGPVAAYASVYGLEILLLLATAWVLQPLLRAAPHRPGVESPAITGASRAAPPGASAP